MEKKEKKDNNSSKIKEKKEKKNNNKVEEFEKQIKELKEKLEEEKLDKLRILAEFENFRKRQEKQLQECRELTIINFVQELLPAIDNFEYSLKMTDNKEMFIKGVEMIHKNLIDTLKQYNIESFIPNENDEFDPYSHDPVPIEKENAEPGKILGVLKKGYKHKDKIIRPARVQILKVEDKKENN
jgi:molecular chaperone GrpE